MIYLLAVAILGLVYIVGKSQENKRLKLQAKLAQHKFEEKVFLENPENHGYYLRATLENLQSADTAVSEPETCASEWGFRGTSSKTLAKRKIRDIFDDRFLVTKEGKVIPVSRIREISIERVS